MYYSFYNNSHHFYRTLGAPYTFFCNGAFSLKAKVFLKGKHTASDRFSDSSLYEVTAIIIHVKKTKEAEKQKELSGRFGLIYLHEQASLYFDDLRSIINGFTTNYYRGSHSALASIYYSRKLVKIMEGNRIVQLTKQAQYEVTSAQIYIKERADD